MDYDLYKSLHSHLLSHGQQELAGHLDRFWQAQGDVQQEADDEIESVTLEEGKTPEEKRIEQGRSGFGYKN